MFKNIKYTTHFHAHCDTAAAAGCFIAEPVSTPYCLCTLTHKTEERRKKKLNDALEMKRKKNKAQIKAATAANNLLLYTTHSYQYQQNVCARWKKRRHARHNCCYCKRVRRVSNVFLCSVQCVFQRDKNLSSLSHTKYTYVKKKICVCICDGTARTS